jgi:hypothetical protein
LADLPKLAVTSAGSWLGEILSSESFPVGKVNFLSLHPLVGLNYISNGTSGTQVNLSDRFMQANFQQPWESSGELSSKCNLTCDETEPGMVPGVGKPVIYLYPQKEQRVQVQVEIKNGHFVTTFPKYDEQKKGWDVIASPDSTLRVFMVFKEVSADTKVKEQKLPATFKRNGFSVVECGGSELDGEWSVFLKFHIHCGYRATLSVKCQATLSNFLFGRILRGLSTEIGTP